MLTVKEVETDMILGLIVAAVVTLFAYYPVRRLQSASSCSSWSNGDSNLMVAIPPEDTLVTCGNRLTLRMFPHDRAAKQTIREQWPVTHRPGIRTAVLSREPEDNVERPNRRPGARSSGR